MKTTRSLYQRLRVSWLWLRDWMHFTASIKQSTKGRGNAKQPRLSPSLREHFAKLQEIQQNRDSTQPGNRLFSWEDTQPAERPNHDGAGDWTPQSLYCPECGAPLIVEEYEEEMADRHHTYFRDECSECWFQSPRYG